MTKNKTLTFSGRAEVYWTVEMPIDQVGIDAEGFDPVKLAIEDSMPDHQIYMQGTKKPPTRVTMELSDHEDVDIDDDPREDMEDKDEEDDDEDGADLPT